MNTMINISAEDINLLADAIKMVNRKYADTLMTLLIKYDVLSQDDIDLLTDLDKCRITFASSSYSLLRMIPEGTTELRPFTHDSHYKPRYYDKLYEIFGKNYIFTNDLYGIGTDISVKNNRNKFYFWVLGKFGISYENIAKTNSVDKEEWWPSKEEYDPGISKNQWLEYLNEADLFTENSFIALASFFDCGGEATTIQLSSKYGNKPDFYRSSCTQMAAKLVKANYCPVPPEEKNAKYWPAMFLGRKNKDNSQGNYIWKLRPELFEALKEFDINRYLVQVAGGRIETPPAIINIKERTMDEPVSDLLSNIKKYIANNGFSYDGSLIENFYLSLKSKPFVILAGTSGTGKTRLVKLFAEAISAEYKLIPVRPDWSDSTDLLGYSDLNGNFHAGEMLKFVGEAISHPDIPYILCLDEMNLARVEYYLSDILSVIETRDRKDDHIISIPLLSGKRTDADTQIIYEDTVFPENFYIIGTVNMDETTFPFSKKVLDRANTIEFNYVDLTPDFFDQNEMAEKRNLPNDFLKTEYLILQTDCRDEMEFVTSVSQELQDFNAILQKANAHVGYRVRDEICFYMLNNKKTGLLNRDEAFDNEIMQKILPRLQGSSLSVKSVLCDLFKEIAGDFEGYGSNTGNVSKAMTDKVKNGPIKYPRSAEKIAFMVRRFEEDGFTSYWL